MVVGLSLCFLLPWALLTMFYGGASHCCGSAIQYNEDEYARTCKGGRETDWGGFYGYNFYDGEKSCYHRNVWGITLISLFIYFLSTGLCLVVAAQYAYVWSFEVDPLTGASKGLIVDRHGRVLKKGSSQAFGANLEELALAAKQQEMRARMEAMEVEAVMRHEDRMAAKEGIGKANDVRMMDVYGAMQGAGMEVEMEMAEPYHGDGLRRRSTKPGFFFESKEQAHYPHQYRMRGSVLQPGIVGKENTNTNAHQMNMRGQAVNENPNASVDLRGRPVNTNPNVSVYVPTGQSRYQYVYGGTRHFGRSGKYANDNVGKLGNAKNANANANQHAWARPNTNSLAELDALGAYWSYENSKEGAFRRVQEEENGFVGTDGETKAGYYYGRGGGGHGNRRAIGRTIRDVNAAAAAAAEEEEDFNNNRRRTRHRKNSKERREGEDREHRRGKTQRRTRHAS